MKAAGSFLSIISAIALFFSVFTSVASAESERNSPSRPYFTSVAEELQSLFSLSFVNEYFMVDKKSQRLNPDDDKFFTPEDIKTIQNDWKLYIQSILRKIFDNLLEQGIDPDGLPTVYDILANFITGCDTNADGKLTKDEARGMILQILPWGVTRALVLGVIGNQPRDEMLPKLLQELKKGLSPEGDLQKIIRELCEAGVFTGKICELPLLPNQTSVPSGGQVFGEGTGIGHVE